MSHEQGQNYEKQIAEIDAKLAKKRQEITSLGQKINLLATKQAVPDDMIQTQARLLLEIAKLNVERATLVTLSQSGARGGSGPVGEYTRRISRGTNNHKK